MLKHTVRNLALAAITVVSAAVLTALGTTGAPMATMAATTTAHPVQTDSRSYLEYENVHLGVCIAENGTTSTVGFSTCNTTNHSVGWAFLPGSVANTFEINNEHSNLCLEVTGDSTTIPVVANSCNGNHAQDWRWNPNSTTGNELQNAHSGLCLQGQGDRIYQTTCDPGQHAQWWLPLGTVLS